MTSLIREEGECGELGSRQAHRDGRKGQDSPENKQDPWGVVLETAQFNEPFLDPTGEQEKAKKGVSSFSEFYLS